MNESRERIRRERERDKNTYTSPRQALRRVLLLSEGRQFREAAAILARLSPAVLQSVAEELPIDLIVEALPHSAHLLETLLGRLSTLERSAHVGGACEAAAWRLVRLAGADTRPGCARLVRELTTYRPQLREMLAARRRQLDAAVHGLGTHGLTADSSGALVSLHAALRTELQRHVDVYKAALHKFDELSPVTVTQAPAASSHQRLLSLSQADIERRLIDNKSLLTVVEKPALRQLPSLVAALAARVESDKEVLSCIGQIKRLDPAFDAADTRPAAGIMMSYSRGCSGVLALMPPASTPPRSPPASSACSDGYHSDSEHEVDAARNYLVSRYGQLFAKAHKETMEALGALDPLQHAHQLKSKIVFSVVVLSFRACSGLRERRLGEALAVLGVGEGAPTAVRARLLAASADALAHTVDTFPLGDAERLVANQVLQTLHEYPCLETCVALFQYIASACRVAWTLCNQQPAMTIDTDFTPVLMRPEKHVRFVSSDQRSDLIRSFIWPALMDGPRCVYKAVVTT